MPVGHARSTAHGLARSLNLSISQASRSSNRPGSPRGEADCKSQARHCSLTRHARTVQAEVQIVLCTLLSKNSMFGFHTQILIQQSARQLPYCKSDLLTRRRPSLFLFLVVLVTWTVTL